MSIKRKCPECESIYFEGTRKELKNKRYHIKCSICGTEFDDLKIKDPSYTKETVKFLFIGAFQITFILLGFAVGLKTFTYDVWALLGFILILLGFPYIMYMGISQTIVIIKHDSIINVKCNIKDEEDKNS